MSGGGGKGGSKTTETTIPAWIRDPAIRNLQRAEDVQRIEYMPYYGPDVAAFTPTQNAAFDANIGAAQAFGLLDPNSNLTATSGMPTPTDFDGFSGYSSQPIYESALAELKANQSDAVAQYDALFGANVPTTRSTGQGGFRGSASVSFGGGKPSQDRPTLNPSSPAAGVAVGDPTVPFSYAVDPIALREGRLYADRDGVPDPIKMREGNIYRDPIKAPVTRTSPTNVGNPFGYGMGK